MPMNASPNTLRRDGGLVRRARPTSSDCKPMGGFARCGTPGISFSPSGGKGVMSRAFENIKQGMHDAIAHARGDLRLVLLYCWVAANFHVLVPKKRGAGYLAVPYGHHQNQGLDRIGDLAGVDVTGLDGALCFECGGKVFHGGDCARAAFVAKVIPPLEVHYGMASREISVNEFWRLHPLVGERS